MGSKLVDCSACHGTGTVPADVEMLLKYPDLDLRQPCPCCKGTGQHADGERADRKQPACAIGRAPEVN